MASVKVVPSATVGDTADLLDGAAGHEAGAGVRPALCA
ncbi:hypothetical protein SAMN05428944_0189 [Streptomyces sp. 1222.5]|nr:hypothetical protein BX260_7904 [Streptomyces sp. 5112.2]SEB54875.1 hypothetical protein SAMN05428944_0189 [Streptomyces sp. 1222.5]